MWFRKIKKKNLSSTKTRPKDENYKKNIPSSTKCICILYIFQHKKMSFSAKSSSILWLYIYTHTYIYEKYLLTVLIFIGSHILNCYSYNSEKKKDLINF